MELAANYGNNESQREMQNSDQNINNNEIEQKIERNMHNYNNSI